MSNASLSIYATLNNSQINTIMKRLFTYLLLISFVGFSSCSYDDTSLWAKVNNHENRITDLEELCKQMNSNISAMQTIVNALNENNYITSVSPVVENGQTIGYTISFTKSEPITIYHGKDGIDSESPVIGIKEHSDGIYYWTLNNEWLVDSNGEMVMVEGIDGITPIFKIEEDYWHISYDNGTNWTKLGKAKGEDGRNYCDFFKDITEDEDYVYFTLADESVIAVLKDKPFALNLDVDRISYTAGTTYNVGFTVTGATEDTTMEVIPSNNLRAYVSNYNVEDGVATGYVTVEMPKAILEYATVAVIVSDGRSKVLMKAIHFDYADGAIEEGIIYITNGEAFNFPQEGGEIEVNLQTNISYRVELEERTAEWLTVGDTRSTLREESLMLYAGENTGEFRHGFVYLVDISNNHIVEIIYVSQNSNEVYYEEVILFADTAFESYMISNFDLDKDGVVTKGEALSAETIAVPTGATDLTGLEYCVNLKSLSLASNTGVTTLNTSTFPLLEILNLSNSKVATIDLSHNPRLQSLNVNSSTLTSLDLAYNNELITLNCSGLKSLTNRTIILKNHPQLTRIVCSGSTLTMLNVSGCTALVYLDCNGNNLSELDVCNSPKLEQLYMQSNSIRSIDLSKSVELTNFNCSSNQLSALDMQACMKLYDFTFSSNPLSSLNLGSVPRIKEISMTWHYGDYEYDFSLSGEVVESLRIGHNKDANSNRFKVKSLHFNTPNFKTLELRNYISDEIDFSMVPSIENISINGGDNLYDIDISKNPNLKNFTISSAKNLTGINFSNNPKLQSVSISSCAGITGVDFSNNPELQSVKFSGNGLTSLDLSNNLKVNSITLSLVKSITHLNLGYNTILTSLDPFTDANDGGNYNDGPSNFTLVAPLLKSLTLDECGGFVDITGCPELTTLNFKPESNSSTTLDLSKQTKLKSLTMQNMTSLRDLDLSHMSELTTLSIKDCSAMQSINASNLKNLTTATIDNLDALTNFNLTDCSALTTLNCIGSAKLPALDCSGCTSLTSLVGNSNSALTTLDISDCTALTTLNCYSCALKALDLSNNVALTTLNCYSNLLETLDISNNTAITSMDCSPNDNLTTLYMKEGHTISKINNNRNASNIPAATEIIYK